MNKQKCEHQNAAPRNMHSAILLIWYLSHPYPSLLSLFPYYLPTFFPFPPIFPEYPPFFLVLGLVSTFSKPLVSSQPWSSFLSLLVEESLRLRLLRTYRNWKMKVKCMRASKTSGLITQARKILCSTKTNTKPIPRDWKYYPQKAILDYLSGWLFYATIFWEKWIWNKVTQRKEILR